MSGQQLPYNWEGIVKTQVRQIELAYGYGITPVFISDTNAHVAPEGSCFYCFRAVGDNAVIDEILDLDGDAVSGWPTTEITPTDFPYNFRASSIQLTSGKIIAYLKIIQDL